MISKLYQHSDGQKSRQKNKRYLKQSARYRRERSRLKNLVSILRMAGCVYHILRRYTLELGIAFDQL